MVDRVQMDEFFTGGCWAVVGVSRDPEKYGSIVHKKLRDRGEVVFAVNPGISDIEGEPCYPRLGDIPDAVDQIVVVVPPGRTRGVIEEAVEAGIRRIWLQPGAESSDAVEFGRSRGLNVVSGHCILRYMDGFDLQRDRTTVG